MRIDAHQHYWRFNPVRDTWITDDMAMLRRDFLPGDVAPAILAAGFDGVVAVQADQSEAETDFLLDLAATHSFLFGVVGWVDLCAPDLGDRLTRRRNSPVLKGFRHVAQGEPDEYLARPEIVRGVTTLGEHGYSYDILVYPRQLAAAAALVERCPGVRFVLDHCAKPAIASGEIAEWRRNLGQLARHANVQCKLSGLVTEANWKRWDHATLLPYLDAAADLFGPERLMFGSDWPVCLVAAEYHEVAGVIARWADCLTPGEHARVFGGTATEAYRLGWGNGS